MKIYILAAKENWITDQLQKEWVDNNRDIYTTNLNEATIIWILSSYIIDRIPTNILLEKKVVTTIHHLVPEKIDSNKINQLRYLDRVTDIFATNNSKCKELLSKYVSKPINVVKLWHNDNLWYNMANKATLRKELGIDENCFLIGSFQRDTEGAGIEQGIYMPKLEKGPDLFIQSILKIRDRKNNIDSNSNSNSNSNSSSNSNRKKIKILLTGLRRHYIIEQLKKHNFDYYYFEMTDFNKLNRLYNCLDLYIVSSRMEGGPRAINECSLTKTPIYSTDVGIAKDYLNEKSIFDMNNINSILDCYSDVEYNYESSKEHIINNYMENFNTNMFNTL